MKILIDADPRQIDELIREMQKDSLARATESFASLAKKLKEAERPKVIVRKRSDGCKDVYVNDTCIPAGALSALQVETTMSGKKRVTLSFFVREFQEFAQNREGG